MESFLNKILQGQSPCSKQKSNFRTNEIKSSKYFKGRIWICSDPLIILPIMTFYFNTMIFI